MIYIYTLSSSCDPDNIRYVGKTNNLKDRLRRHLKNVDGTYKYNWVKSELKKGNKIIIETLDEIDNKNWKYWEIYWINQLKDWGFKLTNGTIGGDGFNLTNDILNKRNKSNLDRHSKRLNKFIKKYNIHFDNNLWIGYRNCPTCKNKIEYKKSGKRSTI